MRPSSGSSTAVFTSASRATVSARSGATSGSKNTVVAPVAPHLLDEPRDVLRARLGLGCEPGEGNLAEAVALGEVPERRVARHEVTTLAPLETAPQLGIESLEAGDEGPRSPRRPQRVRDRPDERRVPDRVEPDVRVGSLSLRAAQEGEPVEHVDGRPRAALDRALEGGLEPAAEVRDEARGPDRLDIPGPELQVVRLRPGWREVHDLEARAADLLRREGEGIERRDDGVLRRRARRTTAAAGRDDRQRGDALRARTILE